MTLFRSWPIQRLGADRAPKRTETTKATPPVDFRTYLVADGIVEPFGDDVLPVECRADTPLALRAVATYDAIVAAAAEAGPRVACRCSCGRCQARPLAAPAAVAYAL